MTKQMLAVLIVTLALAGCTGAGGAPSSNGAPVSAGNSNAGQVVITDAIDKTYAPVSVGAFPLVDKVVVKQGRRLDQFDGHRPRQRFGKGAAPSRCDQAEQSPPQFLPGRQSNPRFRDSVILS